MKVFRVAPLCLALVLLLALPSLAAETEETEPPTETMTAEAIVDGNNITVNVSVPVSEPSTASTEAEVTEDTPDTTLDPVSYSVLTLSGMEATNDNSFAQAITALFGEYTPRTQTVTQYLADGTTVTYQEYVPGLAGLDWSWLAGVALFSITLWSLFTLIGGVAKRV